MRTRLRGLEIAGIQIGIEVPEGYDWEWPDSAVSDFVCLPREPEVHVGLRVASLSSADLGGECYGRGGWTFEVASSGSDWLLGLSRGGVREQLAHFDRDFCNGEVCVSPYAAIEKEFPLRTPLDEWIIMHRTVARGGLVLRGRVDVRGGVARVQLGSGSRSQQSPMQSMNPRGGVLGHGTTLIREQGARLRRFSTPWNDGSEQAIQMAAPIREFEVFEPSPAPYRECLDPDEAAELLVMNALVPLCDEHMLDYVLDNARGIAERTPMFRQGELLNTQPPIEWESAQLQAGLAPPSLGG